MHVFILQLVTTLNVIFIPLVTVHQTAKVGTTKKVHYILVLPIFQIFYFDLVSLCCVYLLNYFMIHDIISDI